MAKLVLLIILINAAKYNESLFNMDTTDRTALMVCMLNATKSMGIPIVVYGDNYRKVSQETTDGVTYN